MDVTIVNMNGDEVGQTSLPADIFEAKINVGLMHQAVVRQMANSRQGTHKAKGRSEINRTTAKMYRQKGTGRARHGSRRAPIFVGGGVAHGPLPRDYSKNMPRKMRRAAVRSALSVKAQEGDIILLDELSLSEAKTKEIVAVRKAVAGDNSALVLIPDADTSVQRAARNLPDVKALLASYVNVRDLLAHDKLIMPVATLEALNSFLSVETFEAEEE
ncbi:MAG TPA: 50S ribosomal protein L4 [Anaerolineae bacterium]|nr:50S ribosomal protein L4 [Anaerolineae bacterium]